MCGQIKEATREISYWLIIINNNISLSRDPTVYRLDVLNAFNIK